MRWSCEQIKTPRLKPGIISGTRGEPQPTSSSVEDCQHGFTLIELIMVMVIVGILAVFVVPRFFDANVFQSRGFADQVQATLRYAQKEAIEIGRAHV